MKDMENRFKNLEKASIEDYNKLTKEEFDTLKGWLKDE